jgi:glycosyltransferase A (GT-A) superfamily protein (DUF2064 family)
VIVVAKAPVPGRVKTRLCPPLSPAEAACLAEAALADPLAAAVASGADRVVVTLDGAPGEWLPPGCVVVAQRGHGLDERLAAAWTDAGGPGVQIGMDTPQVTAHDLRAAFGTLERADAALGLAPDGGWWAIALRRPDPDVFLGVPTSRTDTGRRQLDRLRDLGLDVAPLPVRRDVDTFDDAVAVAAGAPTTRFAAALAAMTMTAAVR